MVNKRRVTCADGFQILIGPTITKPEQCDPKVSAERRLNREGDVQAKGLCIAFKLRAFDHSSASIVMSNSGLAPFLCHSTAESMDFRLISAGLVVNSPVS